MKGLNKVLLVAAIAVPFAAQAELKSIDDAAMADVSGQSGLVIEAGFGTNGHVAGDLSDGATGLGLTTALNWAGAGITIDAFKWEVDGEAFNGLTNTITATDTPVGVGGFLAKDIAIAGQVDVVIDAVGTVAAAASSFAGTYSATSGLGGIGISFSNSDINFRIGDMAVYSTTVGTESSMGAIEIIGMNIDGLDLIIHGN